MLDRLAALDRTLFHWINHEQQSAFFDWLMPFVTSEGHFMPWFLALWLVLLVGGRSRARSAVLLVIPLLVLSDQTSSHLLKNLFERTRPCHVVPDVHLLVGCSHSYSMPSSHAANSGAAAFHFLLFFPRLWSPLLLVALLVAYSRVYCGVHWPGDVLVGLLVGLASALAIQALYRLAERRAALRAAGSVPKPDLSLAQHALLRWRGRRAATSRDAPRPRTRPPAGENAASRGRGRASARTPGTRATAGARRRRPRW